MTPVVHRCLVAIVLLAWMAPGVGALGISLHLALDHHGHHGAEHELAVADLLGAAAHGHHHDADATPDHEHDARVSGSAVAPHLGASFVAVLPSAPADPTQGTEGPRPERALRRGPPAPLFTAHCSLLL